MLIFGYVFIKKISLLAVQTTNKEKDIVEHDPNIINNIVRDVLILFYLIHHLVICEKQSMVNVQRHSVRVLENKRRFVIEKYLVACDVQPL